MNFIAKESGPVRRPFGKNREFLLFPLAYNRKAGEPPEPPRRNLNGLTFYE